MRGRRRAARVVSLLATLAAVPLLAWALSGRPAPGPPTRPTGPVPTSLHCSVIIGANNCGPGIQPPPAP